MKSSDVLVGLQEPTLEGGESTRAIEFVQFWLGFV